MVSNVTTLIAFAFNFETRLKASIDKPSDLYKAKKNRSNERFFHGQSRR
jgi:hypothetical protein